MAFANSGTAVAPGGSGTFGKFRQTREVKMDNPRSTARIGGHPIHPMLVPFPIAFFVAALVSDAAYLYDGRVFWFEASIWLIAAGLVMGVLAALAGITDYLGDSRIRSLSEANWHAAGNAIALLIEAFNLYIRYYFQSVDVFPEALYLSLVASVILVFTGWLGGEMVYRRRVAVIDEQAALEEARVRPIDQNRRA